MLWALPVGPASAIPIQMPLTGGRISMDIIPPEIPVLGFFLDVDIENPGRRFRLTNALSGVGTGDGLSITGGPNTCCTALLSLTYPFDFVHYLDAEYHVGLALVNLFTSSIDLGPVPPGGRHPAAAD